jgi:hypothetical protein
MPADLSRFLVLDLCSGTFFQAENSCLIDWQSLSEEERDTFENGSDTDRMLLADSHGQSFSIS